MRVLLCNASASAEEEKVEKKLINFKINICTCEVFFGWHETLNFMNNKANNTCEDFSHVLVFHKPSTFLFRA